MVLDRALIIQTDRGQTIGVLWGEAWVFPCPLLSITVQGVKQACGHSKTRVAADGPHDVIVIGCYVRTSGPFLECAMVKKALLAIAVLIALLLAFATTRPDTFRVERQVTIAAEPTKVFALLNDFHGFRSWSPWEGLDPAMKTTYSGPASGVGAVYAWDGNNDVGAGRMEIMQAQADSRVVVKLDFLRPFEAFNTSEYTLISEKGSTTVTWAMFGPSPFVSKLMGIFVSMDSMIGKDFERGLANLKRVAEK